MTRRIVVTGPPGCGKTSTLSLLTGGGIEIVREAATDVNDEMLAEGIERPELQPDFLSRIAAVQRARRLAAVEPIQLHDRSVFCTVTLARYLGVPLPDELEAEVAAVGGWFENTVAFLEPLGFITRTAVRRISYEDTLAFGELHREVYAQYGFNLYYVPPAEPEHRAALIRRQLAI